MKSVRTSVKLNADPMLYSAYAVFAFAALFMLYRGQMATIALAIGVALILYAVTDGNLVASLIAGALVGLIAVYYSRQAEGFTAEEDEEDAGEEFENPAEEQDEHNDGLAGDDEEEEFTTEEDKEEGTNTEEGFVGYTAPLGYSSFNGEALEGFANPKPNPNPNPNPKTKKRRVTKRPPPDNGSRGEFFQIGKKYTGPKEEDDADFHLDAGTTFMNAYKSLKPDQIAAMTKDTQELMQTQKQLMSTLSTLKPLITDGKEMMNMFQSYFGSGQANAN